jgi:hypothetical protein
VSAPGVGRELDALIAEQVFGATIHEGQYDDYMTLPGERLISDQRPVPCYSSEMRDAWLVVEVLERKGWNATLRRTWEGYSCEFDDFGRTHAASVDPREGDMPLAICRAALQAVAVPT